MTLQRRLLFLVPSLAIVTVAAIAMGWPGGGSTYWFLMPGMALTFATFAGHLPRGTIMWWAGIGSAFVGWQIAYQTTPPERLPFLIVLLVSGLTLFAASFTLPKETKPSS